VESITKRNVTISRIFERRKDSISENRVQHDDDIHFPLEALTNILFLFPALNFFTAFSSLKTMTDMYRESNP
jgi:hypothetical protein